MNARSLRNALTRWYERNRRDLPWRRTRDPYAIWVSEIMLQQTRVAAAIPYYERFLNRFPDPASLACASEDEVLAQWSGLGYYSRARNLHKAAKIIAGSGFPSTYNKIRELPGIGEYTAAAIASIAYRLPHAAVDGNIRRVIARLTNDAAVQTQEVASQLLDCSDPGRFNQALMELGAIVCLPRAPLCGACPLVRQCESHRDGTQEELPYKRPRPSVKRIARTLLVIRRREKVLLMRSNIVKGFWDLPDIFEGARVGRRIGMFRHAILNRQYHYEVREGFTTRIPADSRWWSHATQAGPEEIPLSTTAKKALRCLNQ